MELDVNTERFMHEGSGFVSEAEADRIAAEVPEILRSPNPTEARRIIEPKRNTQTGSLYHFCPDVQEDIEPDDCDGCVFLVRREQLPAKYRVHCAFETTALRDFDIPKAHDSVAGLKGKEVIRSSAHTLAEGKLDGARAIVHIADGKVTMTTRRRDKSGAYNQFQDNVPHLRDHEGLLRAGASGYTILDGEIVVSDGDGNTLGATMSVVGANPEHAAKAQRTYGKAKLFLFDVVQIGGNDATSLPLHQRRELLESLGERIGDEYVTLVPQVEVETPEAKQALFDMYVKAGGEGLVLKDPAASYFARRAWLKLKTEVTVDVRVTGFEFGKKGGKYEDTVGALLAEVIDEATGQPRAICKVVPGDDATRDQMRDALTDLTVEQVRELGIIIELSGQGWSKEYRIRHPRVVRYRPDRSEPNTVDFTKLRTI